MTEIVHQSHACRGTVAPTGGMPHLGTVPQDPPQPPPRPGDGPQPPGGRPSGTRGGPPTPPPSWSPLPGGVQAKMDREVQRARERAERAARRADRAAGKARDIELRVARKSGGGDFLEAAGDAASAVVTAVSAVADEASQRIAAKTRLNALEQALITARAGGRVDIAPPTRKEALALADRVSPASSTASAARFAGLVAAGLAALFIASNAALPFLAWMIPVALLVLGGAIGGPLPGPRAGRPAGRHPPEG